MRGVFRLPKIDNDAEMTDEAASTSAAGAPMSRRAFRRVFGLHVDRWLSEKEGKKAMTFDGDR